MNVSGEMTVFRNDHQGSKGAWYSYVTSVSKKREDGSWARAYLDVMFRKDVVVENKSRINVKDGFLTVRDKKFTANPEDLFSGPENQLPF